MVDWSHLTGREAYERFAQLTREDTARIDAVGVMAACPLLAMGFAMQFEDSANEVAYEDYLTLVEGDDCGNEGNLAKAMGGDL